MSVKLDGITTAVTGRPPKDSDFKIRVAGRSGSRPSYVPLSMLVSVSDLEYRDHITRMTNQTAIATNNIPKKAANPTMPDNPIMRDATNAKSAGGSIHTPK
ncbi:MAG TPA: hypothetical protein PKA76_19445 [Pirellulaceae bacterium]|nr:hypothetical protein [Pirellulaceae bacterium]